MCTLGHCKQLVQTYKWIGSDACFYAKTRVEKQLTYVQIYVKLAAENSRALCLSEF